MLRNLGRRISLSIAGDAFKEQVSASPIPLMGDDEYIKIIRLYGEEFQGCFVGQIVVPHFGVNIGCCGAGSNDNVPDNPVRSFIVKRSIDKLLAFFVTNVDGVCKFHL